METPERTPSIVINESKLNYHAVFAGFAATVAMSLFMAVLRACGVAVQSLPIALGRMLQGTGPDWEIAQLVGWISFFACGVGVAMAFAWIVERNRPRSGGPLGALFAVIAWFIAGVVVFPFAGLGVFASHTGHPGAAMVSLLASFVVYGTVMGTALRLMVQRTAMPSRLSIEG